MVIGAAAAWKKGSEENVRELGLSTFFLFKIQALIKGSTQVMNASCLHLVQATRRALSETALGISSKHC